MAKKKRRGHGEHHIRQRSNGLWQMDLSLGFDSSGKRIRKSVYGRTKAELHEKRKRLESEHGNPKRQMTPITFKELADLWLNQHHGKKTTVEGYRRKLTNHIKPVIGHLFVDRITPQLIQRVLDGIGLSGSTKAECLTIMRGVFTLGVEWNHATTNPAKSVRRPRVETQEPKPLTVKQCKAFLEAAEDDRLYAYFVLAISTGLRESEMFGLQWSDIDLKAKTLRVNRRLLEVDGEFDVDIPKTATGRRMVNLPKVATKALSEHKARMKKAGTLDSPWVFHDTRGGPLRRQNVMRRHFRKILENAGLPRVRIHDLRHTAATLLLAAGEHPKVVQERLGHSRISTTLEIYSHVLPGMQEKAASRIDKMLG